MDLAVSERERSLVSRAGDGQSRPLGSIPASTRDVSEPGTGRQNTASLFQGLSLAPLSPWVNQVGIHCQESFLISRGPT